MAATAVSFLIHRSRHGHGHGHGHRNRHSHRHGHAAGCHRLLSPSPALPLKTHSCITSFLHLDRWKLGSGIRPVRCNAINESTSGMPFQSIASLLSQSDADANFIRLGTDSGLIQRLAIADIDPATAKLTIGILGPVFSGFSFLFIARIVMSWYPKLPVGEFPYVIAYAPTEPLLIATRKVIPPLGGVDVTPVVWFGLISFLNEILLGPQGLLVLLSQQVGS